MDVHYLSDKPLGNSEHLINIQKEIISRINKVPVNHIYYSLRYGGFYIRAEGPVEWQEIGIPHFVFNKTENRLYKTNSSSWSDFIEHWFDAEPSLFQESNSGIYLIAESYVGSSINLKKRLKQHVSESIKGAHCNKALQKIIMDSFLSNKKIDYQILSYDIYQEKLYYEVCTTHWDMTLVNKGSLKHK